jgi:hypothetical protein
MGKGITQPEIYVLLLKGHKPKDLINIGLPKSTVYNYSANLPFLKIKLKELVKKLKAKR